MSTRVLIMLGLLSGSCLQGLAQSEYLTQAVREYFDVTDRTLAYEDISVQWKMSGRIQAELNEGLNNLMEGNPSLAESNFQSVIKEDSSIWQAYYYRGVCRKQTQQFALAKQDFNRLVKNNHVAYECFVELGKIQQLNNNLKEAEKFYEKAIRSQPGKAMGYYLKANVQNYQYEFGPASKNYKACLELDSLFSDAHIRLALLKITTRQRLENAIPHLSTVLATDSLNRHALLLRTLLTIESNKQQCLSDLNKLTRVNPDNLMALFLRGMLLSELGNYARAFPDFHKVIEATYESDNKFIGKQTWLDKKIDIQNVGAYAVSRVYGLPENDAIKIKKAYCLLVVGNFSMAISSIDETTIARSEPLCVFLKAVAYEHKGEHEAALKFYDRALMLDNDIIDAHKKRGIYEAELKQWDKSIADFSAVLRLNPETFIAHKLRGVSYFYNNNAKEAIADFSRYILRDSTDKDAVTSRGMAYKSDGQILKASVDFANSGNGEIIEFRKLAGSIDSLFHKGDSLSAFAYLNKVLQKVPYFTEGYVMKIRIMFNNNDWKSIDAIIDRAITHARINVSPADHSYLLTIKGMVSGRSEHYEEALEKLNEAIKYDKLNSLAFFERGKMLLSTGKSNKAITDFKKASSLGHKQAEEMLTAMN